MSSINLAEEWMSKFKIDGTFPMGLDQITFGFTRIDASLN